MVNPTYLKDIDTDMWKSHMSKTLSSDRRETDLRKPVRRRPTLSLCPTSRGPEMLLAGGDTAIVKCHEQILSLVHNNLS